MSGPCGRARGKRQDTAKKLAGSGTLLAADGQMRQGRDRRRGVASRVQVQVQVQVAVAVAVQPPFCFDCRHWHRHHVLQQRNDASCRSVAIGPLMTTLCKQIARRYLPVVSRPMRCLCRARCQSREMLPRQRPAMRPLPPSLRAQTSCRQP